MLMKKLAIGAIGLSLFLLGPAATLVGPEPARADDPACQIICDMIHTHEQNECYRKLPPLPTTDDQYELFVCLDAADWVYADCSGTCQ